MVASIAFLLGFCAVSVRSGGVNPPPVNPPPVNPPPVNPPPFYPHPVYLHPVYDAQGVVGPRGGPVEGYGAAPARPYVPDAYPPPAYTYPTPPAPAYSPYYPYMHYNHTYPTPPAPAYSPYYPYMHYNPYLALYPWLRLGLKGEKEKCDGGDGCCTSDSPCCLGEGDCDVDADCGPGLACGVDNCLGDNYDADDDCCYVLPAALRPAPSPVVFPVRCTGDDACCTPTNPCGPGEGDCDVDADCRGSLQCGNDNCKGTDFDSTDDCCMAPSTVVPGRVRRSTCDGRACCPTYPCKEGEGDCTVDDDCEGNLSCGAAGNSTACPDVDFNCCYLMN